MEGKPKFVETITRFSIASQLFNSGMEERLAIHGLTVAQMSILSHLSRTGRPQRVTDIANAVQVGQPAVTKILSKFEASGWVVFEASKNDRRVKLAKVTQSGSQHLTVVQKSAAPELANFLASWDQDDLDRFNDYLTRLGRFMDDNRALDDKR